MVVIGDKMERIKYLDVLKFFAIYLVVLGHTIQFMTGSDNSFKEDILFNIIYTFHMPLFAFISGYFSISGLNKSFNSFLYRRSIQLLLPVFSWSIVYVIYIILVERPAHYMGIVKSCFLYHLWFLKCIWICNIVLYLIFKYIKEFKKALWLFIITCLLLCVDKDLGNMYWISFLLPIYGVGFVVHRKNYNFNKYISIIALVIYIILFQFWKVDYLIYFTPIKFINSGAIDIDNIGVTVLRWLIGLSFIIFIYNISKSIFPLIKEKIQNILSNIGQRTLGIYIIQTFLFMILIRYNINVLCLDSGYVLVLFLSILLMFISYYIVLLLEKIPILKMLFLGKVL